MILAPVFLSVCLFALAQGAAVGHLQDLEIDLAGQELHIPAELLYRDARQISLRTPLSSNCARVSLPARVRLQICGCGNPNCQPCPCANNGGNGGGFWEGFPEI